MLDAARVLRVAKLALPLAVFLGTLLYLTGSGPSSAQFLRRFRDERRLFVADFLEHEVDGQFDGTAVRRLCATRKWTPGLFLSCEPHPGGVGEVKNAHLHCIRFAMEMGAELILPQIVKRSAHDITKLVPTTNGPQRGVPLDYYFDLRHLNDSLTAHCPQMRLHRSIDDFHDVPEMLVPIKMDIPALTKDFVNGTVLARPAQLGRLMWDLINIMVPESRRRYPLRVHLATPTFLFPTAYDPPDFAANFGRLLRVRSDARALAAAALFNLAKTYSLDLDPRRGLAAAANASASFVGVHLRTERDVAGKFPDYETQAARYLDYVLRHRTRLVFLATGASADNVTAFAARARDFDAVVVLKKDLLEGDDLARLLALSWDQQGLVDYEIMLRAGLVAGVSDSSFAWNLAMRRANAYHGFGKARPRPASDAVAWSDQYSTLFGHSKAGEAMQLTIWP